MEGSCATTDNVRWSLSLSGSGGRYFSPEVRKLRFRYHRFVSRSIDEAQLAQSRREHVVGCKVESDDDAHEVGCESDGRCASTGFYTTFQDRFDKTWPHFSATADTSTKTWGWITRLVRIQIFPKLSQISVLESRHEFCSNVPLLTPAEESADQPLCGFGRGATRTHRASDYDILEQRIDRVRRAQPNHPTDFALGHSLDSSLQLSQLIL